MMDANDHIGVVATEINCSVIGTKIKSLLQKKTWQPQLQGSAFLVANDEPIAPKLLSCRRLYSSPILQLYRTVHNASSHFRNRVPPTSWLEVKG